MSEIDTIWPAIVSAFAHYGKQLRAKPGPERRKLLQKRLDEGFSADELVMAVHGYVHSHGGLDREFGNGLTSGHYLRPETVYKGEGFEDRVERGLYGAWEAPKAKQASRHADASDVMAEARREAMRTDARLRVVGGE